MSLTSSPEMFVVESFVMGVTVSPALLGTLQLLCQHPFSSSHTCPIRIKEYITVELIEIIPQYQINLRVVLHKI